MFARDSTLNPALHEQAIATVSRSVAQSTLQNYMRWVQHVERFSGYSFANLLPLTADFVH